MEVFLNDSWVLYFHDPDNEAWDEKSYHTVATMSTASEVSQVSKVFSEAWSKGMFFVMREHIKPVWEDECNRNGGCFSFKVMKPEVATFWDVFLKKVTGETMITNEKDRRENWDKICGISISPKRNYCILRLWVSEKSWNDSARFALGHPAYTSVMFKDHHAVDS